MRSAKLHLRAVISVCSCIAAAGCERAAAGQNAPVAEARVDGSHLVLAAQGAGLAALTVAPAAPESAPVVALNGRLTWDEDVTVRVFSPFAGRVTRVVADVGDHVRAGDALAFISAPDFGQAQADARRASTDLDLAVRTLARQRDLLEHGLVAQKDAEEAQANVERARVEFQRAATRLSLYGGDTSTVDQVLSLRTPLTGDIVERNVTPGQEVRPDQMLASAPQLFAPLFVVTDPTRLWVMLDVPETDLPLVHQGSELSIHAQGSPGRTYRGRVTRISAALDPSTRTLKVRGSIDNSDNALKGEMLVSVVLPRRADSALAVPVSAVLVSGDAHVVFVEEHPGRYDRRQIQVGAAHGSMVPVLAGLRAGERVVTGSALLLEQLFHTTARS